MNQELKEEIKVKPILHLNARGFVSFPEELLEYSNFTTEIYLKWNNITSLPTWLGSLRSLTNLYLSNNHLQELPSQVGLIQTLRVLQVDDNQIKTLSPCLGQLRKLCVLSVGQNKLTTVPFELCYLQELKILNLSGNQLQNIPPELSRCHALEELDLDGNCIRWIPSSLVYLPRLSWLDLAHNQLKYLPSLPFISNPRINLSSNTTLIYTSLLVAPHLKEMNHHQAWAALSNRCYCQVQIILGNTCLHIPLCQGNQYLLLPQGISSFTSPPQKPQVPSLYELSLRTVYRSIFQHDMMATYGSLPLKFTMTRTPNCDCLQELFLPKHMLETLELGPVALCFLSSCRCPLFTHAVGWVVHSPLLALPQHCVVYFCSQNCAQAMERLTAHAGPML